MTKRFFDSILLIFGKTIEGKQEFYGAKNQ